MSRNIVRVNTAGNAKTVPVSTSGLNYSGYVWANKFTQTSADICKGTTATLQQVNDVMPNSISKPDLPRNKDTGVIQPDSLGNHVRSLMSQGIIPGNNATNFDEKAKADATLYKQVQAEYCFYEARYTAAMEQLLIMLSNQGNNDMTAVNPLLDSSIALNMRLNSLLEILNYVSNDSANIVNQRSPQINEANKNLNKKLAALQKQYAFLSDSDIKLNTQEEMIRYSSEKSRAMNIQIMFFVALNVVALGTIITVYKNVSPFGAQ
jgi:hypothetical protein